MRYAALVISFLAVLAAGWSYLGGQQDPATDEYLRFDGRDYRAAFVQPVEPLEPLFPAGTLPTGGAAVFTDRSSKGKGSAYTMILVEVGDGYRVFELQGGP
jgi:hypothetical protein